MFPLPSCAASHAYFVLTWDSNKLGPLGLLGPLYSVSASTIRSPRVLQPTTIRLFTMQGMLQFDARAEKYRISAIDYTILNTKVS